MLHASRFTQRERPNYRLGPDVRAPGALAPWDDRRLGRLRFVAPPARDRRHLVDLQRDVAARRIINIRGPKNGTLVASRFLVLSILSSQARRIGGRACNP